jgi:hypothetical protein
LADVSGLLISQDFFIRSIAISFLRSGFVRIDQRLLISEKKVDGVCLVPSDFYQSSEILDHFARL